MARPREFDRDAALKRAMSVFWAKGYAGTSTDDLLEAMSIGRQSMYGAFGVPIALLLWINFTAKLLLFCAAWTATQNEEDSDGTEESGESAVEVSGGGASGPAAASGG